MARRGLKAILGGCAAVGAASLLAGCCGFLASCPPATGLYTPLFAAVVRCDTATVQKAVEANPGLVTTARENQGATLLHDAANRNCGPLVDYLLAKGADPNATKDDGVTPLDLAGMKGEVAVMGQLVAHGARVNQRDHMGWTALDRAEKWRQPQAAAFLAAHGGEHGPGSR